MSRIRPCRPVPVTGGETDPPRPARAAPRAPRRSRRAGRPGSGPRQEILHRFRLPGQAVRAVTGTHSCPRRRRRPSGRGHGEPRRAPGRSPSSPPAQVGCTGWIDAGDYLPHDGHHAGEDSWHLPDIGPFPPLATMSGEASQENLFFTYKSWLSFAWCGRCRGDGTLRMSASRSGRASPRSPAFPVEDAE